MPAIHDTAASQCFVVVACWAELAKRKRETFCNCVFYVVRLQEMLLHAELMFTLTLSKSTFREKDNKFGVYLETEKQLSERRR